MQVAGRQRGRKIRGRNGPYAFMVPRGATGVRGRASVANGYWTKIEMRLSEIQDCK